MHDVALVWFRRDLRLADNPALTDALDRARAVVPVTVEPAAYRPGAAATAWRARSLVELDVALRERGSSLAVFDGPAHQVLPALAHETGATLLSFTRAWDPESLAEETRVAAALEGAGVEARAAESAHLVAPGALTTHAGTPYRVFTPYWRAWERAVRAEEPLAAPARVPAPPRAPRAGRHPAAASGPGLHPRWRPGEAGAAGRLARFAAGALGDYAADRDRPGLEGTSELSAHLAAGEISVRQVLHAVSRSAAAGTPDAEAFVRQLAWRDFAAQVLGDFPDLAIRPLRPEFARFPWRDDPDAFDRWKAGTTGFPLVDAGMRQLARTGWMHNRVRLAAASVLVKDFLVPWQNGERYFRDALVDYDPAQNAFNWQWVAGSGADAAPYFRIFNPAAQGRRFDPDGTYVRAWVPELEDVNAPRVHAPYDVPAEELLAEGGAAPYPPPLIDHASARERALTAYRLLREGSL